MKPKHKAIMMLRLQVAAMQGAVERIEEKLGTKPPVELDDHLDHFPGYLAESEDEKAQQQRIGGG